MLFQINFQRLSFSGITLLILSTKPPPVIFAHPLIKFLSIKILYSSASKFCFKNTISYPVSILKIRFETSVMLLIFLKNLVLVVVF